MHIKKILLRFMCALLLLAALLGGFVAYRYQATTQSSINIPAPSLQGSPMPLVGYHWQQPVLGGLLYKQFAAQIQLLPAVQGPWQQPQLQFVLPQGYQCSYMLFFGGRQVHAGSMQGWSDALVQAPGSYALQLRCERTAPDGGGWGYFDYYVAFDVAAPPLPPGAVFVPGTLALHQGDIASFYVYNLEENVRPSVQTSLGMAVFTPWQGGWFLAVGIANTAAPGQYPLQITAGDELWQGEITVQAFAFDEQNLTIDVTDPVIGEANSPAAYQQYRETIPPLFSTYDEQRYWEGVFILPSQGDISTPFGAIRYTNGDYANPSRHNGLDIAADAGSDVLAPNNGRVVLAQRLLNTGNTIVIEHGGGLKSYYYHLQELLVQPEDMVQTGQLIGLVGSTGYSTGAHLHFEMRIGAQPISPSMLFLPGAGLYSTQAG